LHLGVKADVLPSGSECHHILLEDWENMEAEQGTIFVSIPTLLDPSLAPPDHHIIHTFTPSWIDQWQKLPPQEYQQKKEAAAHRLIERLKKLFPKLDTGLDYIEIGTARTHRRFLNRIDGSYGPIPRRKLLGLLGMPFNRTLFLIFIVWEIVPSPVKIKRGGLFWFCLQSSSIGRSGFT